MKINNIKTAKDIFETSEMIEGITSGGIAPNSKVLSVCEKKGIVTISYRYQPECGLSDRIYHPVQDIFKKTYEFDERGIFKGDVVKELNPYMETFGSVLNLVEDFFIRNPAQKIA